MSATETMGAADARPAELYGATAREQLEWLLNEESDVKRVLALELLPATVPLGNDERRWAYLIETPFMTFPKFAWGTTNALNNDVRILGTCGAEWSAIEQFTALLAQGGEL